MGRPLSSAVCSTRRRRRSLGGGAGGCDAVFECGVYMLLFMYGERGGRRMLSAFGAPIEADRRVG